MPVDDKGRIVCVTHKDEAMLRQPSYYFLTQTEKNRSGGLNILASNGMPLIIHVCKICGYVESYAAMAEKDWAMKKLYVKCKNDKCKREFLSPIQMDESSFETGQLKNNQHQCYFCKQSNAYNKEDYLFK